MRSQQTPVTEHLGVCEGRGLALGYSGGGWRSQQGLRASWRGKEGREQSLVSWLRPLACRAAARVGSGSSGRGSGQEGASPRAPLVPSFS